MTGWGMLQGFVGKVLDPSFFRVSYKSGGAGESVDVAVCL